MAIFGLLVFVTLIFIAIFADFIALNDPCKVNLSERFSGPSIKYPLGQDQFGRCILSRIIYGARVSLEVGIIVVGVSVIIGVTVGIISGYKGGLIDGICMRIVDAFLAFPSFILALAVIAMLGRNLANVMLALSAVYWVGIARLVRGETLSIREKEYILGAKAIGASDLHIILFYVLPNVIPHVIVYGSLMMSGAILTEAGLSFLGMGVRPPTPSWGSMLSEGRDYLRLHPNLCTFSGLAIFLSVLGLNLLGDGIRDALDPWLKH